MILSDRDIAKRCSVRTLFGFQQPMIWPFVDHKVVHDCGFSYGLSGASYDLRIAEDLVLPPNPVYLLQERLRNMPQFFKDPTDARLHVHDTWLETMRNCDMRQAQLAHTLEYLTIPDDVCAFVVDKSSYARRFVSAMNTLFDPGFKGYGVLELVNLGAEPIVIQAGEPICQMVFHKMSSRARKPYAGKYQNQTAGAHGTRYERPDGSWATL